MQQYTNDINDVNFIRMSPLQQEVSRGVMRQVIERPRESVNIRGLQGVGQVPDQSQGQTDWMPIVIIIVSAMALITLYAVINKR